MQTTAIVCSAWISCTQSVNTKIIHDFVVLGAACCIAAWRWRWCSFPCSSGPWNAWSHFQGSGTSKEWLPWKATYAKCACLAGKGLADKAEMATCSSPAIENASWIFLDPCIFIVFWAGKGQNLKESACPKPNSDIVNACCECQCRNVRVWTQLAMDSGRVQLKSDHFCERHVRAPYTTAIYHDRYHQLSILDGLVMICACGPRVPWHVASS